MVYDIKSVAAVERLAEIIAALIVDIDDVVLTVAPENSLIGSICRALKTKASYKLILQIQKAWSSNKYGVRDLVQKRLNEQSGKYARADSLKFANNSVTSDKSLLDQKEDPDLDPSSESPIDVLATVKGRYSDKYEEAGSLELSNNFVATEKPLVDYKLDSDNNFGRSTAVPETISRVSSPLLSSEYSPNMYGGTPKSSKRTLDMNYRYNDMRERVTDNNLSIASSSSAADSSNSSDESVPQSAAPSQSPSIRKKFCTSLGTFKIPSVQLLSTDGKVNNDRIRNMISACMRQLRYSCPLSFYGGIRSNLEFLVTYAKCRYPSHVQSFKFDVTDLEKHEASIIIKATEYLHEPVHTGPKIFCTLKGEARTKVKAQLQHVAPRMLQLQTAEKIDREMADDGHMQELMRLTTYQKAKSEESCKNDKILRSNDLSDLFQQHILDAESSDPYIRHTGLPLYAHMYSEEHLNVIDMKDMIVHFDSTGCVVRKPIDVRCKRIMYYAMVTNKNSSIIPIAEMVSSEHDVSSISTFLKKYRYFLTTKNVNWPIFRVVVVDWSWALINSVINEWNMMTVTEYLKQAFDCLMDETNPRFDIIVVHSCCAHFQKRVSVNIHKKFQKYMHVKNFILECVGLMIHCRTIDHLDEVYQQFVTVLLTTNRYVAERSVVRLNEMHHATKNSDELQDIGIDENDVESASDDKPEGRIYTDSPFFQRYYKILLSIKSDVIQTESDNHLYAPEVADYITDSFMPYAPMWSALLLKFVAPDILRLSNSNVECHFNIIKKQVLDGQVNLKVGRFIDKLKKYKSCLCAEASLRIPLKGTRSRVGTPMASQTKTPPNRMQNTRCERKSHNQIRATADTPNNPLVQEMWQRKRKAKYSHLEGRLLGAISKRVRASRLRTSTPKPAVVCLDDVIPHQEQSLLNQSDSSNHVNALPNGLFMDVEYYMQAEYTDSEFTIGRYFSTDCAPIIGFDEFQLYSEQYQTLNDKRYLDGAVIDAYTVATSDFGTKIIYVPTIYTTYLIGDSSNDEKCAEFRMYNISDALKGKMFMPYVSLSHWCLLVIDIDAQTIMHLDPMTRNINQRGKNAIAKFHKYVKDCENEYPNVLCNITWTEVKSTRNRPLQKDSYNCGMYVLYYIECLAKDIEFDPKYQPDVHRVTVAESLLKMSRDMKEVCQYCFGERHTALIMCNTCRRWAHQKCLNRVMKIEKTLEERNEPTANYRCALCAREVRQWMRY